MPRGSSVLQLAAGKNIPNIGISGYVNHRSGARRDLMEKDAEKIRDTILLSRGKKKKCVSMPLADEVEKIQLAMAN